MHLLSARTNTPIHCGQLPVVPEQHGSIVDHAFLELFLKRI